MDPKLVIASDNGRGNEVTQSSCEFLFPYTLPLDAGTFFLDRLIVYCHRGSQCGVGESKFRFFSVILIIWIQDAWFVSPLHIAVGCRMQACSLHVCSESWSVFFSSSADIFASCSTCAASRSCKVCFAHWSSVPPVIAVWKAQNILDAQLIFASVTGQQFFYWYVNEVLTLCVCFIVFCFSKESKKVRN